MYNLKPVNRSRIRIFIGKKYFILRRYIDWYIGNKRFAANRNEGLYSYIISEHRTPLIRKLKDVDMWLQYNKITNLKIAIKYLNGIVVNPGETFSFWKLVGRPSRKKGYVDGIILYNGGFKAGIGGGLCQLSNLIYWLTLHTPLQVTERYRHSYDIFPDSKRIQPFGSGATCVYNYRDLQIYNGTNMPFQLNVYLTDDYLNGEWRSTKAGDVRYEVYERNHHITHEFWGGYVRHNELYRKIYSYDNKSIDDEFITRNDAVMMYQPFLEEVKA